MRARRLRDRSGMTLVELLVAMLVATLVLSAALGFLRQQGEAVGHGMSQFGVLQNYRFALSTLGRDLRTAGAGVVPGQPALVYAGEDAVAFNADYLASAPSDYFAVYVDTGATPAVTEALTRPERMILPGTLVAYPDTTYEEEGANSPAETIVFFFAPDSATERGDDFVLWRQVNADAPAVVARNLLRSGDRPFFEYLRLVESDTAPAVLREVSAAVLPLRHAEPVHGAPADTGAAARIDRVRAIRVNLTATSGRTDEREVTRAVSRVVRLPNAGVAQLQTCGDAPQLGTALQAAPNGADPPAVVLRWGQSADEDGGEADVLRYVIWRKTAPGDDWSAPFVSIPAGEDDYVFVDSQVERGATYWYALAVQDCTPARSSLFETGAVTVP